MHIILYLHTTSHIISRFLVIFFVIRSAESPSLYCSAANLHNNRCVVCKCAEVLFVGKSGQGRWL